MAPSGSDDRTLVCPRCWLDVPVAYLAEGALAWLAELAAEGVHDACPRCGSFGCTLTEHADALVSVRQRVEAACQAEMERAKIPSRLRALLGRQGAYDAYASPWAVQIAEARRTRPRVLVLAGKPGSGKSVAAAAELWRIGSTWPEGAGRDARRARIRWLDPFAMMCLSPYEDGTQAMLDAHDALVLDDLGQEYSDKAGFALAVLGCLIAYVYDHEKTLLVTTNLDARAFAVRYGERVVDRLREVGVFIELGVGSLRRGRA